MSEEFALKRKENEALKKTIDEMNLKQKEVLNSVKWKSDEIDSLNE